jgi:hypothetical protein
MSAILAQARENGLDGEMFAPPLRSIEDYNK